MEIKTIKLTGMRNDAHFQFHTYTVEICNDENFDKLKIRAEFLPYRDALVKEDELFKQIEKSELTEKIKDADKARDKVYSSITAIIKTTLKHYNPEVVEAGKRLTILVDTYGKNVTKKSYDEQTAAIYNILQEFKGKYAEDVELIRITEMVNELERANLEVEALVKQRMNESTGKNTAKMKELRGTVDQYYLDIRKRINAAVVMEGEENYATFINKMNVLIDRYKTLIARTKGKKKDDPTAEDVDDTDNDL